MLFNRYILLAFLLRHQEATCHSRRRAVTANIHGTVEITHYWFSSGGCHQARRRRRSPDCRRCCLTEFQFRGCYYVNDNQARNHTDRTSNSGTLSNVAVPSGVIHPTWCADDRIRNQGIEIRRWQGRENRVRHRWWRSKMMPDDRDGLYWLLANPA